MGILNNLTSSTPRCESKLPAATHSNQPISTSPLPPNETEHPSFLERCYYCNKKLEQGNDLYMYGSLKAFCTIECRQAQIDNDSAPAKVRQQSVNASASRRSSTITGSKRN